MPPEVTRKATDCIPPPSGAQVQLSATRVVAPTTSVITRSASSKQVGLATPDSVVLLSCLTPSSQPASKRVPSEKVVHGGEAGKAQTEQQPDVGSSVVTRGMSHDQLPPSGLWARRSGSVVIPISQGNSAPSKVQVYKHTCYTLVH